MPSLRTTVIAGLACLGSQLADAAGDVEVRLLRGVCGQFQGAFQSGTGNAMVGDLDLKPAGTGTFLDTSGASFSSILEQQRGVNPWETMAYMNATVPGGYRIACTDEDGIGINSGGKYRPIRVNTERDATLVYDSYGLILEPYAHYIDGVRQPGVFLGVAGETRWAWNGDHVSKNNPALGLWVPRLRIATDGKANAVELRAGEVAGYLWAPQR